MAQKNGISCVWMEQDNESALLYEIKEVPASDTRSCLLYSVGINVSHYQETLDLLMLWLTNQNQVFQKKPFNKHFAVDHRAYTWSLDSTESYTDVCSAKFQTSALSPEK